MYTKVSNLAYMLILLFTRIEASIPAGLVLDSAVDGVRLRPLWELKCYLVIVGLKLGQNGESMGKMGS